MPFSCKCRHCLGESPDGKIFTKKKSVEEHARRYGTLEYEPESSASRHRGTAQDTSMDTEVENMLESLLAGTSQDINSRKRRRMDHVDDEELNHLDQHSFNQQEFSGGDFMDISGQRNRTSEEERIQREAEERQADLLRERADAAQRERADAAQREQRERAEAEQRERAEAEQRERAEAEQLEREANINSSYKIEDILIARQFIRLLENAKLEDLDEAMQNQIRNPLQSPPELSPTDRFSLDVFLGVSNASQQTYNSVREAYLRRHPDQEMLSHYEVKGLVQTLSGVTPLMGDMCYDSCTAFTGPFAKLTHCPICGEERYTKAGGNVPRKQFPTFPIGPQLQALSRSAQGATQMKYRRKCTDKMLEELQTTGGVDISVYRDFFDGSDYLEAVLSGNIKPGDIVLMLSLDGAQLYRMKTSETWIYIWVILDLDPSLRYKKKYIIPGGIVPGPNKPQNMDSFLFPGLHHLSVLQRYGLQIWDGLDHKSFRSDPFLAFVTADGPAMASVSGQVGHHGKHGCRLYCPLTGRHKPGAPHYYPGLQKPDDYHVEGCDHDDIELLDLMKQFSPESARERYTQNLRTVEKSRNQTNFEKNRLETGICKPTIFSGLPATRRLAIPSLFPGDNMHLPCLNITDLFIPLWRGKLDCDTVRGDNRASWDWVVLTGDVWKEHGRRVAAATPYIPGSFDRPPRNPAEKISSGYKAWEFLLYFYGLGPALLHGILPEKFYRHYCKGVRGLRMMLQEAITVEEVLEADRYLSEFCSEYEDLYIQRKASRLHFSRQSMHIPAHMPHEVLRCGPGGIYSQWVMERTIGNLGEEIKQHSDAFSNLGQRALRRCQVNALKSIYPDLDDTHDLDLPRNAVDLGGGYAFLPACDTAAREIAPQEMLAIHAYMHQHGVDDPRCLQIVRWARLRLPNGQIGRTSWKESVKPFDTVRASRHVKFVQDQQDGGGSNKKIAEILYFVLLDIGGHQHPIAVAQQFGLPDADLMDLSYETYYTAPHLGDAGLVVFNAKSIESVVMMAPDEGYSQAQNYWYLMEKPGLTLISSTFGAAGIGEEEN